MAAIANYGQDCVFCLDLQPILIASPQISREFQISTIMEPPSIILAGASIRSLAATACRIGYQPICCDFFHDADTEFLVLNSGGTLLEPMQSFAEITSRLNGLSSTIPFVWSGGLENYPAILQEISRIRPVRGTPPEAILKVRNHPQLFQFLNQTGIRTPASIFPPAVNSENPVHQSPSESDFEPLEHFRWWKRWISKPLRGSGGIGIHRVAIPEPTSPKEFSKVVHQQHQAGCFLQELEEGVPMSATFITNGKTTCLIGCCIQLNGLDSLNSLNFSYCGSLGPVQLPAESLLEIESAGRRLLQFADLRGIFGIDFILQRGKPIILEVNPRLTATHEHFDQILDQPLLRLHLAACADQPPDIADLITEPAKNLGGTAISYRFIVYASEAIQMSVQRTQSLLAFRSRHFQLTDIPRQQCHIAAGTPFLSVNYSNPDLHSDARHPPLLKHSADFRSLERDLLPEFRGMDVTQDVNRLIERFWEHCH